MPRKRRRAGAKHGGDASFLMEFNPPIGPGPVWPLRFPGFRALYLPTGTVCLIERSDPGGPPNRILVLNRSLSPFYPPREFWRMRQLFRKMKREGQELPWIAFYPGRSRPQYVRRPLLPQETLSHVKFFFGRPGRKKKVDYDVIRQFHREHPSLSQAGIARRLKVRRPTVGRALSQIDASE